MGEIRRDSFLEGLKVTNQIAAHERVFLKIRIKTKSSEGISTVMKRLVSNAYKRMLDQIFFKLSLIYNKNNKGPSKEPCVTPASM